MTVSFVIFLAIIWGIFGLWGFLRGWKAALVMLVMILGTLLMLSLGARKSRGDVRLHQQGRGDGDGRQQAGSSTRRQPT